MHRSSTTPEQQQKGEGRADKEAGKEKRRNRKPAVPEQRSDPDVAGKRLGRNKAPHTRDNSPTISR